MTSVAGEEMRREAPAVCDYVFHTTAGAVTFRAYRALSPHGADRLHNLARLGYYDSSPLYRILPGFVAQFGVAANPSLSAVYDWRNDVPGSVIPDESPVLRPSGGPGGVGPGSNGRHWLAYSASYSPAGVATNRTAELFVSLVDNTARLDAKGFAAFARVVSGGEVLDKWYAGYGEMDGACDLHKDGGWVCEGPDETKLYERGVDYITAEFPRMDRIARVEVGAAEDDSVWQGAAESSPHSSTWTYAERTGTASWVLIAVAIAVGLMMWVRRCVVSEKVRRRALGGLTLSGVTEGGIRAGVLPGVPLFVGDNETEESAAGPLASQGAAVPRDDGGGDEVSSGGRPRRGRGGQKMKGDEEEKTLEGGGVEMTRRMG